MSTLFFEGFDRGTTFNKLDNVYWSSQFKQFPKYAFGGYISNSLMDNNRSIGINYSYSSPNNGLLPTESFTSQYNGASVPYPGFGNPAGFLALSNIEVESSTIEYPTYLQMSGFALPSGDKTYFGFRSLGIENKHTDYSPYPHRHLLFSMCSGNTTGLVVNIVKITGNNLFLIGPSSDFYGNPLSYTRERATLGLEIQQSGQTLGVFDLNISNIKSNFRISPVFQTGNQILNITDTTYNRLLYQIGGTNYFLYLISRWLHSEFLIDHSDPAQSYVSIRAEAVELPLINDDPEILREDWSTELPINKFTYDNIRFYNRTYSSSILNNITVRYDAMSQGFQAINLSQASANYYMLGKTLLLDDITLIDNINQPSFWLGPTAKVMPLVPAINNDLRDNIGRSDGILDWTSNSLVRYGNTSSDVGTSHRKALVFLDADTNSIEAINSGSIDAVAFDKRNLSTAMEWFAPADSASYWRETLNDGIGGMKIYNSARKSYLDTKFINVFRSGISDPLESNVSLLLHYDSSPIIDSNKIPKSISSNNVLIKGDNFKFGEGSLYLADKNSYLSIGHGDLGTNPFTIEGWVYFQNNSQIVALFDKTPASWPLKPYELPTYTIPGQGTYNANYYSFATSTSGVIFKNKDYCDKILLFDSLAQTGIWNHIAIARTTESNLVCYLNGVAGTSYKICDCDSQYAITTTEYQGTYNDIYSLNSLSSSNLTSNFNLSIGKPRSTMYKDSIYENVSLLLQSETNSIIDSSLNTKNIVNSGVSMSYDRSIFGDRSIKLTSNSSLNFDNSSDFNFGTDNFTIEFWINLPALDNAYNTQYMLFSSNSLNIAFRKRNGTNDCTGNSADNYGILVYVLDNNGNAYYLSRSCSGTWWQNIISWYNQDIRTKWIHISIVRVNGMMYAYVNGVTSIFFDPPQPYSANIPFNIDCRNFTLGNSLTCYIDNFRITKGVARYTTRQNSFVAPSLPFGTRSTAPTDPGLYLDDYRVTYGANRYTSNFTVPDQPFKGERDDYKEIGPVHNVNKTIYQNYQHYAYKNPATNQNWTVPQINSLILGVKKL